MTTIWRAQTALLIAAVAVGVGGIIAGTAAGRSTAPLPAYGTVPSFALIDQARQPVTAEQLRGSVWIADFIFTRCSGQCPMMSAAMARLAKELDPRVALLSITVDPEWDKPEVLAEYAATYGASPRWRFATGERAAIERLCREGFLLAAGNDPTEAEPITHSGRLVLVDRAGAIRGYYDPSDAQQLTALRRDVAALLKSG